MPAYRSLRSALTASALCAVLLSTACAGRATSRVHATAPVPLPPRSTAQPVVVPAGREAVYDLINTGTLSAADDLLDNVWDIPRYQPAKLATPLTWTEDPYHQPYWRFLFYSLRPTSNLVWAYATTHERKYLDKLVQILYGFVAYDATDPARDRTRLDYPHGAAFRAMILVNDYAKLKAWGALPRDLARALERSIDKVGGFLADPDNYNGTYNHGFTEVAALLLIAVNFADFPRSIQWRALALGRLTSLMKVTVGADGVEIERSPFYHFYVFDFALQLQEWSERATVTLPAGFNASVAAMERYSTYVIWPNGQVPVIGSSVQLRPSGYAALYAELEKTNPEFAFAVSSGARGTPPTDRAALFSTSGQVVLRSPIDTSRPYPDNSQLVFTGGPPSTEHSHLDALALTFYSGGTVLLPDSGLDTYAPGPTFDYFHGTSAHNTVVVDGRPQGPGPVAPKLVTSGPNWEYVSAAASLYAGVTHKRSVLLLGPNVLLVVDSLDSSAAHSYQQLWHLPPASHVTTAGLATHVTDSTDQPQLQIVQGTTSAALTLQSYYGATNPLQGWYSNAYGQVAKNHVVGYTQQANSTTFYTLIAVGTDAGGPASVTGTRSGAALHLQVCTSGTAASVQITDQAAPGELVAVGPTTGCPHGR